LRREEEWGRFGYELELRKEEEDGEDEGVGVEERRR